MFVRKQVRRSVLDIYACRCLFDLKVGTFNKQFLQGSEIQVQGLAWSYCIDDT